MVQPAISSPEEVAARLRVRLPYGQTARLTSDSRCVSPGDAFLAWPGQRGDGRRHVMQAVERGAVAIVVDASAAIDDAIDNAWQALVASYPDVELMRVSDLSRHAGRIASLWAGRPSAALDVVAVTGTNGKTSSTHWIAQGANAVAGREGAAVIGTLGAGVPGHLQPTGLTTPSAIDLQIALGDLHQRGIDLVAAEASSIGLEQHRLAGTWIKVAALTNLTRDHLDHHGSMVEYEAAKARLFGWAGLQAVVLPMQDDVGRRMLARVDPAVRTIGYALLDGPHDGTDEPNGPDETGERKASAAMPAGAEDFDVCVLARPLAQSGRLRLSIESSHTPSESGEIEVELNVIGRFNVLNALVAAGCWLALDWSIEQIAHGLQALTPVPGRMQFIGTPSDDDVPLVVVDYAHTPDALKNVLTALRPIAAQRAGRLWCVFGAGGDRDPGKRPEMAAAVSRLADVCVLTSDNPRSEDPAAILAQLGQGLGRPADAVEADRGVAIARAVAGAASRDVILIAGKGHETTQEINGRREPFSDWETAVAALRVRGGGERPTENHRHDPVRDQVRNDTHAGSRPAAPTSQDPRPAIESTSTTESLFTLRQVFDWLPSARLLGRGDEVICRVSTDTRDLRVGDLFVALAGERFDAHDFVKQARDAGAVATLQHRWTEGTRRPVLFADDTRQALASIAGGWRRELGLPVIAVTGSNGKTTVKEMIAAILVAHHGAEHAFATRGNLNNDVGVPLSLLAMRRRHRAAVIEMGMNHPGEIAHLAAITAAQVALVNNAQREHQEFLDGAAATAHENGAAIAALDADGVAVYPGDDEHTPIWDRLSTHCRRIRFGLADDIARIDADARERLDVCAATDAVPSGFDARIGSATVTITLQIAGRHNVRNALAAAACCHSLGLPADSIVSGLAAFVPVAGRLRRVAASSQSSGTAHDAPPANALREVSMIDDTYNANPDSVRAAIDVLMDEPGPRLLILGDMGEVGDQGPEFHLEVGAHAKARGIEHLLTLGELTRHAATAFGDGARHFDDIDALVDAARELCTRSAGAAVSGADASVRVASVLVKGSRFMRMERVLHALTGQPATTTGAH